MLQSGVKLAETKVRYAYRWISLETPRFLLKLARLSLHEISVQDIKFKFGGERVSKGGEPTL